MSGIKKRNATKGGIQFLYNTNINICIKLQFKTLHLFSCRAFLF